MFYTNTQTATELHKNPVSKKLTREQVREEFDRKGLSVSEWATAHDLPVRTVYAVLAGHNKGCRGAAHRAAVLLGLKDGIIVDAKSHDEQEIEVQNDQRRTGIH